MTLARTTTTEIKPSSVKKRKRKRVRNRNKNTKRDTTNWNKKGGGSGRTVAVAFRLGEDSYGAIALLATEAGTTITHLIRDAAMDLVSDDPIIKLRSAAKASEAEALDLKYKVMGRDNQIREMQAVIDKLTIENRNLAARQIRF